MKLNGCLDCNTVERLWKDKSSIFTAKEVDLTDVSKIDSSGIAFLVIWSRGIIESSGEVERLRLKNHPQEAVNLITLFKVKELFEILN